MTKKSIIPGIVLGVAASVMVAQSGKILQPQMEPEGGWSQNGTLGQKTGKDWTDTTVGAAVNKKPLAGKTVTVTGEIVDLSCYLQLGKHGAAHKSCGSKCLTSGEPVGLVTQDGKVYMLMAEEHDPRRDGQTTFRKAAIDNFAKVMQVTGTESNVNGFPGNLRFKAT